MPVFYKRRNKDLSLGVVFVGVTQNPLFSLLFQLLFYPPSPTIESTVDILSSFGLSLSRSFLLCSAVAPSCLKKFIHSFFGTRQSFQEPVLQQHLDWTDDASLGSTIYSILLPKTPLPLSSSLLFLSLRLLCTRVVFIHLHSVYLFKSVRFFSSRSFDTTQSTITLNLPILVLSE